MARFLQWSDLHREFGLNIPYPLPTKECPAGSIDAILIAGDLHSGIEHVYSMIAIQHEWEVPVISIRGNHEYYHQNVQESEAEQRELFEKARALGHDIRLLDREVAIIGDTRILGCTLWTDFDLIGDRMNVMTGSRFMMNDYRKVRFTENGRERQLQPEDTRERHQCDRSWLLGELARPSSNRTLVMTHHIPVPEALAAESGKADYSPAYCSDMRADILDKKVDIWVSGHSHWARRGTLPGLHGPIAFTSNMQGYPRQRTNFEPYRVIDTNCPTRDLEPIGINEPCLAHLKNADEIVAALRLEEPAAP